MRIYEFGKENPECILLIPALPGYDLVDDSEFSSVEAIALKLADELADRGIREVNTIYGCSMGGSIAFRMAADDKVRIKKIVMDGSPLISRRES